MVYFQIFDLKGEPQPPGTLKDSPDLCGDCFTLLLRGVKSVPNKAKNVGCIPSSQPLYQDVVYCRHGLRSAGLYMKLYNCQAGQEIPCFHGDRRTTTFKEMSCWSVSC